MSHTISGYYCNQCEEGVNLLDYMTTGSLLNTSKQSGNFQKHILGRPKSPVNGVFFDTGTVHYQSGGSQIGRYGFVEVEMGGEVNAYFNFSAPIGQIQYSGIVSGNSSLGKAVSINRPNFVHWYAATGYGSPSGFCANCGQTLF